MPSTDGQADAAHTIESAALLLSMRTAHRRDKTTLK
jgi:hypothetical protein